MNTNEEKALDDAEQSQTDTISEGSEVDRPDPSPEPPSQPMDESNEDADADSQDEGLQSADPELQRAIRRRQQALERARAAEAQVEQLNSTIAELQPLADAWREHQRTQTIDKLAHDFGLKPSAMALVVQEIEKRGKSMTDIDVDTARDCVRVTKNRFPDAFEPVQTKGSPVPGQGLRPGPARDSASAPAKRRGRSVFAT